MDSRLHVVGCRARVEDPEAFVSRVRGLGRVEAYDAKALLGREHLEEAWARAQRAFADGRNRCGTVEMEARLYASCERQIKGALERTGVKAGDAALALASEEPVAIDAVVKAMGLVVDASVIEPTREKLLAFGVCAAEIEALGANLYDIIFERMALTEVDRG
jgi:KEOPS complex subunit Cgi121